MQQIHITHETYLIAEKIFIGTLSPLKTYMGREDFLSVATKRLLTDGAFYPVPISLPVEEQKFLDLKIGEDVYLTLDGVVVGVVSIADKFVVDPKDYVKQVFLTDDPAHPGVKKFLDQSGFFIGGDILIYENQPNFMATGESGPARTKKSIADCGAKVVVGFATRNVPHQGHVYIISKALEWADMVLILATIGSKNPGGYHPDAIALSFKFIQEKYGFGSRLRFGFVSMPLFLSGPNEAMLQAIIRKNYGCSHFIVGRDHSGIGGYYTEYQAQQCALAHQEMLGIKIVAQKGPYYCRLCCAVTTEETCTHRMDNNAILEISSSAIRAKQIKGEIVNKNLFDCDLQDLLNKSNKNLFIE